MQWTPPKFLG
jgi:hypothetical protein